MKVRARLIVRNAKMLEARDAIGMTQAQLASLAQISIDRVKSMERMDFRDERVVECVPTVAGVLGIAANEIMPDELDGVDARMDTTRTCDIEPKRLLDMAYSRPAMLTADVNPADKVEAKQLVDSAMGELSDRERSIINSRFYDDLTMEETGVKHRITREHVRQIEANAIRKMQKKIAR